MEIYIFVFAYILDLIIGDPVWVYHPITFIGKEISVYEKFFSYAFSQKKSARIFAGFLIVFFTIILTFSMTALLFKLIYSINYYMGLAFEIFFCSQLLATKCLRDESMNVFDKLDKGIAEARKAIGRIVGRDTENLSVEQIIKAAIETVAENTGDGIVAPMLYISIFGTMGGVIYKCINTMDSMIGYKNEKYEYLGKCAAKLDDIANFIPSRIGALIMLFSAFILKLDYKNAFKIFIRDRNNHKSPNSGQLESVAAGALNLQLGGNSFYFGKLSIKPYLGDNNKAADKYDIVSMNKLMYTTSIISFLIFTAVKAIIFF